MNMTKGKEGLENRTCKGVILWVDDSLEDKFPATIMLLERKGYFIERFTIGDDAADFISGGGKYDLALIDMELLSRVDGVQVMKLSKEYQPKTKVICITGYAIAPPNCADSKITIPIEPDELIEIIERNFS